MDLSSYIKNLIEKKEILNNQGNSNPVIGDLMQQAYPDNQPNFLPVWVENDLVSKQPIQGGISQNAPQTMQIQDTQPLSQNNGYQLTSATNTPVQPQVPQPVQTQPMQTNNGFIKGIADFAGDFQRGYNENRNNAFSPENLLNTQFSETVQPNNNKLEQYQNQLLNNGYDENVVNAVADKKNSGNKEIDDWIKNNSDAYATTKYYDKGIGGKIGEGIGTAMRFANSPTGQAIIGGAVGMLTGNPMFALSTAYNAGSARTKNDIYNQALQKYQIEPTNGFFYNVNDKDLASIADMNYKQMLVDHYFNSDKEKAEHNDVMEKQGQQRIDNQFSLGQERNSINNYKAHNSARGKGKGTGNPKPPKTGWGSNGEWTKEQYDKNLKEDLADYSSLNAKQQAQWKNKMIRTYGEDFLSQESKLKKDPLDTYFGE